MATFSSTPKGWEVRRLKSILRPHKKLVGKRCNEYDLLSLTLRGIVKRDMENPEGKFPASFETYQEVNSGDFVFCMFDNEETPRAVGLSSLRGMITGAYDVMSLIAEGVSREFLNYYFLWVDEGKRLKPLYKGLRKTVPLDSFLAYKISLPPLPEQKAIVAYLDAETGRIDKAIAAEEKMIALLQERLQGVLRAPWDVAEATPCKTWESRRAKFIWKQLTAPSSSLRKIGLENIESFTGRFIESSSQFEGSGIAFEKGDILYGKLRPYLAKVWIAEFAGNAVGDFFVYRLNDGINARYLHYYMRSPQFTEAANASTYGAKMPRVSADYMANFPIPLPPLPEQEAIVERLDRETGKIDRAIEVKRRQIELLRERRQIVIDEVVTGKVKVA